MVSYYYYYYKMLMGCICGRKATRLWMEEEVVYCNSLHWGENVSVYQNLLRFH